MAELEGIWWSTAGDGPVVVLPRLNVDWTPVNLSALTARFQAVIVAPRGFGPSARPGSYSGTGFVRDVERILDHLAIESYATFGYSMNGAMAARLAVGNPRVTAVACGGFPLTADLTGMAHRARARHADAHRDGRAWAELVAAHDPEAAVAFWDDISRLAQAALAEVACPVKVWWGDLDDVVSSLQPPDELARNLASRNVEYDVVPGRDHEGLLERLDLVLPMVSSWLAERLIPDSGAMHDAGT
jgi:pimeloyl-ACP methyl ester carboxylesterase